MGRACRSSAFLLAFDSATVFRGEKRQRQSHGAENSLGGTCRFGADSRTLLTFVLQVKFFTGVCKQTGFRDENAGQEQRVRAQEMNSSCVNRLPEKSTRQPLSVLLSKSRKVATLLGKVGVAKSGAPPTWRACRATLPLL